MPVNEECQDAIKGNKSGSQLRRISGSQSSSQPYFPHLNAGVEVLVHRLPEAGQDVEPLLAEDGVGRLQGEVVVSPGGGGDGSG